MMLLSPKTVVQDSCRIVTINDVLGTCTVTHSPQSVSDAMKNHGGLGLAQSWIEEESFVGSENEPIAVSIRRGEHVVIVHWHAIGDIEAARDVMQQILSGVRRLDL